VPIALTEEQLALQTSVRDWAKRARCLSIAGGTTQIPLSLVGGRLLGLPREELR